MSVVCTSLPSPATLVISATPVTMDMEILDDLLDDLEDYDDGGVWSPYSSDDSDSPHSPPASAQQPVEPKRIKPELDPLPLASVEERTEYFTVSDYVWPAPKKRQCKRMPEELRRQRHRESQREFMTRKRAQFKAMRAEIRHLEGQLQWLKARRELTTLTKEQQALQTKLKKSEQKVREHVGL